MKQIFDWLREQIETRKGDAETRMYRLIDEDRGDRCVYSETDVEEFSVNTWADALSILDEAEAKWEAVIEQMEEYRAKFDCRICKYNKTEKQVCTKDCTDALIDGLLEIVRKGGVE